jgi:hypothetical protein
MARKSRAPSVVLDSFLDIMTCMLGVLMLIILMTGIDASQIRVLIPTPMEHASNRRPIFIECRNNELFQVPVTELRKLADEKLKAIAAEAKGDTAVMLQKLAAVSAETDAYKVDLTYALLGQFAIVPVPAAKGYRLVDAGKEKATDWFGRILTAMNMEKDMLTFLVRDDSYEVFKRARALAWHQKVEVSYELLDVQAPIKFGLGGSRSLAQ